MFFLDARIRHVGTSFLRKCNAETLKELGDKLFVIQHDDEPISVLLSYELFHKIQSAIVDGEKQIAELQRDSSPKTK